MKKLFTKELIFECAIMFFISMIIGAVVSFCLIKFLL